jgi:flagellar basal body-associated protein FliL
MNIIIGVVALVIFIYIFWFYKSNILQKNTTLTINNTDIDMTTATDPSSYRYNTVWVFVNTWTTPR